MTIATKKSRRNQEVRLTSELAPMTARLECVSGEASLVVASDKSKCGPVVIELGTLTRGEAAHIHGWISEHLGTLSTVVVRKKTRGFNTKTRVTSVFFGDGDKTDRGFTIRKPA